MIVDDLWLIWGVMMVDLWLIVVEDCCFYILLLIPLLFFFFFFHISSFRLINFKEIVIDCVDLGLKSWTV